MAIKLIFDALHCADSGTMFLSIKMFFMIILCHAPVLLRDSCIGTCVNRAGQVGDHHVGDQHRTGQLD